MKKIALLVIVVLVAGSCSLFEKPSMTQEEIDSMVEQNVMLQDQLINAETEANYNKLKAEECNNLLTQIQQAEEEKAAGLYVVVAGSFKTPDFANDYASKMQGMGKEGAIVEGPSDFKLVTYSSHSSLSEAIESMEEARMNVAAEAWVYMKK